MAVTYCIQTPIAALTCQLSQQLLVTSQNIPLSWKFKLMRNLHREVDLTPICPLQVFKTENRRVKTELS